LDYQRRGKELEAMSEKITALKKKLAELSGAQSSSSSNELFNINDIKKKFQSVNDKYNQLHGTRIAGEDRLKTLERENKSERYVDIDRRTKHQLIDVQTAKLVISDLDAYAKALDKALMHFHSIKMKEINDVLKDYWRSVYRGKDIDEVYIASDSTVLDKRRTYNYRVVMKSGDTSLDMRGRCSAGQKVLASLLIRLALADTFW
jgi:DNA repair protein RAD50